jgi:hypothetical protein
MIKSRDDQQFALRVGLQAGYRFSPYWRDGDAQTRQSFYVIRPIIAGNVFRNWIRFWTSLELAQDRPFLLDSYLEIQPIEQVGLRIGQQYTPLSRHEYLGPEQVLMADWAPVANYFWTGRDKGVTLFGTAFDKKLDYFFGIYAGSPPKQSASFAHSWVSNARVTVNPMGPVASNEQPYITSGERVPTRISFTLQSASGNKVVAQTATNPSVFGSEVEPSGERNKFHLGSADIWLQGPRYVVFSEVYVRRAYPKDATNFRSIGLWAQAGYMLIDRTLDMATRFNWLNASDHKKNDTGYSIEGQFGYYPFKNQNLTAKVRYAYAKQHTPNPDNLAPSTLLFPAGTNHILTLQLMLAI